MAVSKAGWSIKLPCGGLPSAVPASPTVLSTSFFVNGRYDCLACNCGPVHMQFPGQCFNFANCYQCKTQYLPRLALILTERWNRRDLMWKHQNIAWSQLSYIDWFKDEKHCEQVLRGLTSASMIKLSTAITARNMLNGSLSIYISSRLEARMWFDLKQLSLCQLTSLLWCRL